MCIRDSSPHRTSVAPEFLWGICSALPPAEAGGSGSSGQRKCGMHHHGPDVPAHMAPKQLSAMIDTAEHAAMTIERKNGASVWMLMRKELPQPDLRKPVIQESLR